MLYKIAFKFKKFTRWIFCSSLLIAFLGALAANVLVLQEKDASNTVLANLIGIVVSIVVRLLSPGLNRILTFSIFGLIIFFEIFIEFIVAKEKHSEDKKIFRKYLFSFIETNQGLNPKGFAQSQALISVNVPLEKIFIHLRAVPDRPIYDVPSEQQALLEELRLRLDLKAEDREERFQRLRVIWHSQLGQELAGGHHKQNIAIEEALEQLTVVNPVAVVLGTPGSGKSTAMRWLALQMARASLSPSYHLPDELSFPQIPILVQISDYALFLNKPDTNDHSLKQFLKEYFAEISSDFSTKLLEELEKGNCMVLFDGLDEVMSDSLRRRVAEATHAFISNYSTAEPNRKRYNRFIITSRIVGYEAATFAKYAHYTLLDLEDEEIRDFLSNWCLAVERYQIIIAQGMKPLTPEQERQAKARAIEQQDRLLKALRNSPGIKRLAINPLMLTLLALIQRSGRALPQRRIELYQIVTRTLLDNWNKEKGYRVFPTEEVPLVERLLGDLAYRLHSSDSVLTEQDVRKIISEPMANFYQLSISQISDSLIQEFMETLRSSSGLFIESGQGLFGFMHRTFQEYYVALYLLRKSPEELRQFVVEHYRFAIWREPLLLAIAYKSSHNIHEEQRQEVSDLIQSIMDSSNEYDTVLHRNLLFAANSMVDCSAWLIDKELQYHVANNLFDLYGDALGSGRYTQLQREIETVTLLWLRGQPQGSSQQNSWSPLLEAWRTALCKDKDFIRQEGAVHLLAAIAPDLSTCPKTILSAITFPLLQLANLDQQDFPYPPEISAHFPQPLVSRASSTVEEYAFVTLRLLDELGPAGWLHSAWLKWDQEQPKMLERLTEHALELDHLITPAALPLKSESPDLEMQYKLITKWRQYGQRNPRSFQMQLLRTTEATSYPLAYLLKQMLASELTLSSMSSSYQSWRNMWDEFLQKEMSQGKAATYQSCLYLRLLLCQGNRQQYQEIADELMRTLTTHDHRQIQALITIINIFKPTKVNLIYLQELIETLYFIYDLDLFFVKEPTSLILGRKMRNSLLTINFFTNFKKTRNSVQQRYSYNPLLLEVLENQFSYLEITQEPVDLRELHRMKKIREILRELPPIKDELKYVREIMHPKFFLSSLKEHHNIIHNDIERKQIKKISIIDFIHLFKILSQAIEFKKGQEKFENIRELKKILNRELIIEKLCDMLMEKYCDNEVILLIALFSVVCMNNLNLDEKQYLNNFISAYNIKIKQTEDENTSLLYNIINEMFDFINESAEPNPIIAESTDSQAEALLKLRQQLQFSEFEIEKILAACTDLRRLSIDKSREVGVSSLQEVAWGLLGQQFTLNPEAFPTVLHALDNNNATVCATAALLLKGSTTLPHSLQRVAAQKIRRILADYEYSRRTLISPDFLIWRLDDVLFETLKVLAE